MSLPLSTCLLSIGLIRTGARPGIFSKSLRCTIPFKHPRRLAMSSVQLTVQPEFAVLDETITISIKGLDAAQPVTVAACVQEAGMTFVSHAYYWANRQGEVSLKDMASIGGTYVGVEPMGLFWSMVPAPSQKSGLRLTKKDSTTPYEFILSVVPGHVHTDTVTQHQQQGLLGQTKLDRSYMARGVKRVTVKEGKLRGALYIPEGKGPFPSTLDIYGTAGGLIENRAAMLASRGFLALTLAYFRYDDLPQDMYHTNLEYFEEGLEYLENHPLHNKRGIGVLGVSQGAELMLSTASISEKVKACVAINGFHYRTVADHHHKGVALASVHPDLSGVEYLQDENGESVLKCTDCYDDFSEDNMIPVENAMCNFLIINSGDDGMVKPVACSGIADRLEAHGKHNYEAIVYPSAGHLLEMPHAPHCKASFHIMGTQFYWGGQMRSHSYAQTDSWRRIIQFLRRNLT